MNAIEVKNLKKSFGNRVLFEDLNLTLPQGKMTAIMGASGSGKSTLLNIMGMIEPYDEGCVYLFGKRTPKPDSSQAAKMICNHISYLFQNYALIDDQTVKENLQIALHHVKESRKRKDDRIAAALAKTGLSGFEQRKVYELSGGEQQRVAVARALLKPGELILADEPTGALDAKNRDAVISLLRFMADCQKTVVIVTHDPVVAAACDQTILLD